MRKRSVPWTAAYAVAFSLAGCYSGLHRDSGSAGPDAEDDSQGDGQGNDGEDADDGDAGDDDDADDGGEPIDEDAVPIATGLRRLTRAEFDYAIEDLLGDTSRPATLGGMPEDLGFPFLNDYRAQLASAPLIEGVERIAAEAADRVLDDPARKASLVPCNPSGAADEECLREFIVDFGRRAFRRPLTTEEVDAFASLVSFGAYESEYVPISFDTALGLVIRAMLQDANFLYRVEIGEELEDRPGVFRLDAFELATRLSFLVWGSIPDDELLDLAESGLLSTAQQRVDALARLLDDDRALRRLADFHGQWLGYRNVALPPDLAASMQAETLALIERATIDPDYDYLELFTATDSWIESDALADHYELSGATPNWLPVDSTGRGGILGQATFLAAHNNPNGTSPTKRGVFVREWLMCNDVPPPPPEAADELPDATSDSPCKVQRLVDIHHAEETCAQCHESFDPIGFGLERFDALGRYRTHETDNPQTQDVDESVECELPIEGNVPGIGPFSGPGELGVLLAESGALDACIVQQVHRFAVGRDIRGDGSELARLSTLRDRFAESGYDFRALLTAFVQSDDFILRSEDEDA